MKVQEDGRNDRRAARPKSWRLRAKLSRPAAAGSNIYVVNNG